MKKLIGIALALGLIAGSFGSTTAGAAVRKPVKTTLYLHGVNQAGELDGAQWFADGAPPTSPMTLTTKKPGAGQPKSMNYFSPALNDQCSGLPVAFPTFTGNLKGTIVGKPVLKAHFLSAPADVTFRLWTDTPVFSCNDGYIPPASEKVVSVPGGHSTVKVVFDKLRLRARQMIMIEVLAPSGTDYRGQVGRLLYDSKDMASSLTFKCIPARGNKCA